MKEFRRMLRSISERQPLPEYGIRIDRGGRHELVTLYRDRSKPGRLPRGLRLSVIEGEKTGEAGGSAPGRHAPTG